MNNLNFEYDVRIPVALIKQMMEGEITAAMLLTMNMLYLWSNWNTGKVRRVCASSLCYASGKAFSERTFSEALRKLEWMRWITRRMVKGSTKWYPVLLHNYKWVDDAGKVHILNPTEIKVYEKFPEGRRDEASWEGSDEDSDEDSDEGSDEGSDRHKSLPESELQYPNESLLESEDECKNNNNQPVVVVPQAPTEVENETPGLVSGYTPEQIASHAEACKLNPWVHTNDGPNARKRPAFVAHLMTIDPPRKPLSVSDIKPTNPAFTNTAGTDWAAHKKKVEEGEK
jgi:hypothetical protein